MLAGADMAAAEPTKAELVFENDVKRIFSTSEKELAIQEFKDDEIEFDGERIPGFPRRGAVDNRISSICFAHLEKSGVSTHFQKELTDSEMLITRLNLLPVRVTARNVAAGNFAKRIDAAEGTVLPLPVYEYRVSGLARGAKHYNRNEVRVLESVTEGDVRVLDTKAKEINVILMRFFHARGMILADLTIEFGRDKGKQIRLAGGITPVTCRLWDRATHEKLDKDRFSGALGRDENSYREILKRVSIA